MKLIPLPAFADNYIWMLHDGHTALVVDPGDAQPVLAALQREGLQLQSILVTHHHADHTGGVAGLRQATGALSRRDLEPMLVTIAENAQTARSPAAIEFVANELTLRGFQPGTADAGSLARGLAAAGYSSSVNGDTWVVRTDARAAGGARP